MSLWPLLAVVRRCRHSSKRFILRPRRASPPGLVQTVLVAVNKIVVFVDNKSREGRVWRAVYLDEAVRSLLVKPAAAMATTYRDRPGFETSFRLARKSGSFPRHRPRVPGIRATQIGSDAIARLFFERRAWARDPFERILLFLTRARRTSHESFHSYAETWHETS